MRDRGLSARESLQAEHYIGSSVVPVNLKAMASPREMEVEQHPAELGACSYPGLFSRLSRGRNPGHWPEVLGCRPHPSLSRHPTRPPLTLDTVNAVERSETTLVSSNTHSAADKPIDGYRRHYRSLLGPLVGISAQVSRKIHHSLTKPLPKSHKRT